MGFRGIEGSEPHHPEDRSSRGALLRTPEPRFRDRCRRFFMVELIGSIVWPGRRFQIRGAQGLATRLGNLLDVAFCFI